MTANKTNEYVRYKEIMYNIATTDQTKWSALRFSEFYVGDKEI